MRDPQEFVDMYVRKVLARRYLSVEDLRDRVGEVDDIYKFLKMAPPLAGVVCVEHPILACYAARAADAIWCLRRQAIEVYSTEVDAYIRTLLAWCTPDLHHELEEVISGATYTEWPASNVGVIHPERLFKDATGSSLQDRLFASTQTSTYDSVRAYIHNDNEVARLRYMTEHRVRESLQYVTHPGMVEMAACVTGSSFLAHQKTYMYGGRLDVVRAMLDHPPVGHILVDDAAMCFIDYAISEGAMFPKCAWDMYKRLADLPILYLTPYFTILTNRMNYAVKE
jgi:hypothetical protein